MPLKNSSKKINVPGHDTWQFTFLLFGLHKIAATMPKLMDMLFPPDICIVSVYLDDLIIATETIDEHIYEHWVW